MVLANVAILILIHETTTDMHDLLSVFLQYIILQLHACLPQYFLILYPDLIALCSSDLFSPTSSENYISVVHAHFVLQLSILQHLSFDMLLLPVFVRAASSMLP